MFKYVPVLRYQQEEKAAFKAVQLSGKTLPLIELVHEKGQKKTTVKFADYYKDEFKDLKNPILIDIPTYLPLSNSTKPNVSTFLQPIIAKPTLRASYYNQLSDLNIIPVVSYIPSVNDSKIIENHIETEFKSLSGFKELAFRVFKPHFEITINKIEKLIRKEDILIFDLNKAHHQNSTFKSDYYTKIQDLKRSKKCKIVIIRSVIHNQLSNGDLPHNKPINEYDNTLLRDYSSLGFDAFGDYAGIKKDNLTKGGPGGICGFVFYNWNENNFIGYRGNNSNMLSEYSSIIVPTVMNSKYYKSYSAVHKKECPGCQIIKRSFNDPASEKVNQFAKWKRISIMHYLYTMEEFL